MEKNRQEPIQQNHLEGEELMAQLATLTGLPDALVRNELSYFTPVQESAQTSDQQSLPETLEELRAAMIAYLEAVNQGIEQESQENSQSN